MCIALPGRVTDVDGEHAEIDVSGATRRVSISLLLLEDTDVALGDWVLASAGLAVRRLPEQDALDLLETLGG